jgi:hypothetical protein
VTESFPNLVALRKAQEEVAEFQRFHQLSQNLVAEVSQLLGRVFAQRRKDGRTDLEAVESALRTALHQAGAAALAQLLQIPVPATDQGHLPCSCGDHSRYQEKRSKPLLTNVDPVRLSRPYYLFSHCNVGQFPVDLELDIENTEFSPRVRRMHALVGRRLLLITAGSRCRCWPA